MLLQEVIFKKNDFKDVTKFMQKIAKRRDPLSQWIFDNFSSERQAALLKWGVRDNGLDGEEVTLFLQDFCLHLLNLNQLK